MFIHRFLPYGEYNERERACNGSCIRYISDGNAVAAPSMTEAKGQ